MLLRLPVSHIRMLGFKTQLPNLASSYSVFWEAVDDGSGSWIFD